MVGRRGNFFIPSSRVLLWSATFIMLSVAATTERQCYWCGPLAEQVHRSRRAPPCDFPTEHVTTCEPGLMHCAIVATAPPHVESRFCVKLYQDECYPLFCNSTRTWKMTCPCRGDLCNGNNTEREDQAFVVLSKLVAKSQNVRIKKRAASDLASSRQQRTIIITNVTELQLNQTDDGANGAGGSDSMIVVTSKIRGDFIKEPSIDTPTKKTLKENSISGIHDDSKQSQLDNNHSNATTTQSFPDESTTSTSKADSDVKTNAPTVLAETDEIKVTPTNEADIEKELETTKVIEIVMGISTTKDTGMTEADAIKERDDPIAKETAVIPSEQLPTNKTDIVKEIETTKVNEMVKGISTTKKTGMAEADTKERDDLIAKETAVIPNEQLPSYEADIAKEIETTKMSEIVKGMSTTKKTEMAEADTIKERDDLIAKETAVIPSEQLPSYEADITKEIETTKMGEIVKGMSTTKKTGMTEADTIKKRGDLIAKETAVIPSEQLPTAKALQQNVSPTAISAKPTEDVKPEPTESITTVETENNTTVPLKSGAAYTGPIPAHFFLIAFIKYLTTN